jgi:hypothetical protein
MRYRLLVCFVFGFFALSTRPQSPAPPAEAEPKKPIEWFLRANDRMSLRMPGSAPFHMKVTFHAFPGDEILTKGERSEIVTGDGVYEETWLAPHLWRREVTLAGYHAIETYGSQMRKMQASSDYEPSRVLMLLNALLDPIPRNLVSFEYSKKGAGSWKVDHVTSGSLSLVRISSGHGDQHGELTDAFYFTPHGILALRNRLGLTTAWADDLLFAGIVVPKHLTLKAGDRNLLTAEVAIEAADKNAPALFDLPGGAADPGMTLRPLQFFEVRWPDMNEGFGWTEPGIDTRQPGFSLSRVLDRHGRWRELELIQVLSLKDAGTIMTHFREERNKPATIDGSPCEVATMVGAL